MKKTIITLFYLMLLGQISIAQTTTVMFLDIPTVNGEYITPSRTTVTPAPTKTSNLLISNYFFSWVKNTRIVKSPNSSTSSVNGGVLDYVGEMTVNFQIDVSVIALFDRLVNNTKVPIIDLFIDKPANNNPTPQTEIKRIRMEGVTISELSMINTEIPQYKMELKFEKVSIIDHNISGLGVVTKGIPYGRNFVGQIAYNYSF